MTHPAKAAMMASIAPFLDFYPGPLGAALARPGVSNFAVGNPNDMPIPAYVDAAPRHLVPQEPGLVRLQAQRAEARRRPSPDR